MTGCVHVRELAGWGFDDYAHRPKFSDCPKTSYAASLIAERLSFQQTTALLEHETCMLRDSLSTQKLRDDLHTEMSGLDWSLGVVDLRRLVAFQRRLSFNPTVPGIAASARPDWPSSMQLCFAPPRTASCDVLSNVGGRSFILQSANPNVHLRLSSDPEPSINIHAGSPFFETAQYNGRWFLRDGYHRAYALLQAGIFKVPAVIVLAKDLQQLGATQPWFFSEETLFSTAPPLVTDFLDDNLIIRYDRPALIKTLRVTVEETFTASLSSGERP